MNRFLFMLFQFIIDIIFLMVLLGNHHILGIFQNQYSNWQSKILQNFYFYINSNNNQKLMRAFGTVTQKTEPVQQTSYVIKLVQDTSPQMIIKKPQAQINKINRNPAPQYPHIIEKKPFYHEQKIHVLSRQPITFQRPPKPQPIIAVIPPANVEPIMTQNSDPNPLITHLLQSSIVSQYKQNQIQQPQPPLRQQVVLDQDNQMNISERAQRYSRVYRANATNTAILSPPIRQEEQLSQRTQHITLATTGPLNIYPPVSHPFSTPTPYEQLSERTEHIVLGTTEPLVIPPPKLDEQLSQRTQHMRLSATQPLLLPRQQIIQQARQNLPVMSQVIPNDDNSSVSSKKSYVNFTPTEPIYLKSIKKQIKNNPKPTEIPTPPIAVKKQEKEKDSESEISVVEFNPLNPILIEPSDQISVVECNPIKPILINAHR